MWGTAYLQSASSAIVAGKYFIATIAARVPDIIGARNGLSPEDVIALNPGIQWPCNVGERVKVG